MLKVLLLPKNVVYNKFQSLLLLKMILLILYTFNLLFFPFISFELRLLAEEVEKNDEWIFGRKFHFRVSSDGESVKWGEKRIHKSWKYSE